ncbi:MAG: lytic transglycosylase domain-containing protein [Sphingomicrobium sp.]
MSSMWRNALLSLAVIGTATSSAAQYSAPYAAPSSSVSIGYALNDWRTLRQSSGYRFSDYARLLVPYPGWPENAKLRRWAEKSMRPGEAAATVIAFFTTDKPLSGNGYARLADAYASAGRMVEALAAAKEAWGSDDLSASDEQAIWARYGGSFTAADHDRRIDALLFAKDADNASRFVSVASPQRQAAFGARVAMLRGAADAESRYQGVIGTVTQDAGLMMDRARYLRAQGYDSSARQLFARQHAFVYRPADAERFYDMQLLVAGAAAAERDWGTTYNIARQIDDVLPVGASVADQSLGVRDKYTSLAWLGGTVALDRMNQPSNALAMFNRYGRAGRSLQVQSKGDYWAGRAALASAQSPTATAYFQRASAYPEMFYGQLALERLGRTVPAPPQALPQMVGAAQRAAFNARPLVQAVRVLGQQGRAVEQALFVRALAESLTNDADRNLAVELGDQLRRPDLAVWTSRSARIKGTTFYVRQAYPMLPASLSGRMWPLAHGISRQESSFDPYAISGAGARGMMQLMPGTAREQAGKMGVGYDSSRLLSDPSYNISLGAAYFQRMLNIWDGNVPLAVASYNAGSGNAGKWVRNYGDPRGNVDVLKWIEAIPFSETKAYVQRVVENSVVYDAINARGQQTSYHVSKYLGKSRPG